MITALPVSEIVIDGDIQQRAEIDERLIADYAENIAAWQSAAPVVVYRDREGRHWLADGFHRHGAVVMAGLDTIHVEIRDGDRMDAIRHSLRVNGTHGKRREALDRARAYQTAVQMGFCEPTDTARVAELLECTERQARDLTAAAREAERERQADDARRMVGQGKSQREIAAALGVSVGTVNSILNARRPGLRSETATAPNLNAPESAPAPESGDRAGLHPWQQDILKYIDAEAALNGKAKVAEALRWWLGIATASD